MKTLNVKTNPNSNVNTIDNMNTLHRISYTPNLLGLHRSCEMGSWDIIVVAADVFSPVVFKQEQYRGRS